MSKDSGAPLEYHGRTAPFNPSLPTTTRDGREVRIYATDAGGGYPIHGAIKGDYYWAAGCWAADGRNRMNGEPQGDDLINPTPRFRREVWCNVIPGSRVRDLRVFFYDTKEEADRAGSAYERKACKRVPIEGAEGDTE